MRHNPKDKIRICRHFIAVDNAVLLGAELHEQLMSVIVTYLHKKTTIKEPATASNCPHIFHTPIRERMKSVKTKVAFVSPKQILP
jgi:hypothetical protein